MAPQPWLLLLLALALPGLLLLRTVPAPARLLQLLVLLLLAGAALDPELPVERQVPARIETVCTAAGSSASSLLQELAARSGPAGDRPGAVFHGDVPAAERGPQALAAAALRAGPRADELVVAWTGPLVWAAAALPRAAAALSARPPLSLDPSALRLVATGPLQVGRPAALELQLAATAPPLHVDLRVRGDDGADLAMTAAELASGRSGRLAWTPARAGTVTVAARVERDGVVLTRTGRLTVLPAPRVLVLEHGDVAAAALRAQGMDVTTAAVLPAELSPFAAVLAALELPPAAQVQLVAAVDDGLGLLLAGAALPDHDSPLTPLLPVHVLPRARPDAGTGHGTTPAAPRPQQPPPVDPPTPAPTAPANDKPPTGDTSGAKVDPGGPVEVDKHEIAMVLVVDRSFSMGDEVQPRRSKMSYAKTSALRTAQALGEGDSVGIVTFGNQGDGRIVLPLTPATEHRTVRTAVERLAHAAENTYLHAGLLTASEMLRASKAAVKHAVVISDGEIVLDESLALRMLAREMREHGITVSIIQIAGAHPEPSQTTCCNEIATTGGGNYLPDPDPTRVPALVSSEVQRALGRAGRKPKNDVLDPSGPPGDIPPIDRPKPAADPPPPTEGRPTPRRLAVRAVAESPLLQPKPAGEWPTLGEVLPCTGRSDAQVLLVAGDDGTPLLAFGNHGLGRVAAFAVDPGSDAAAEFRTDTAFPGRFAQWVTALLAPVLAPPPADLCQGNELSPSVPTPAEAAALQALAGSPLRLAADWQPPGPRREVVHLGQAAEWAIAGVAALLLLAFVEWWFGRWSPKTGTSG